MVLDTGFPFSFKLLATLLRSKETVGPESDRANTSCLFEPELTFCEWFETSHFAEKPFLLLLLKNYHRVKEDDGFYRIQVCCKISWCDKCWMCAQQRDNLNKHDNLQQYQLFPSPFCPETIASLQFYRFHSDAEDTFFAILDSSLLEMVIFTFLLISPLTLY